MYLSFEDKLNLAEPIVVYVTWFNPNANSGKPYGNEMFILKSAVEKQDELTIYTLSISVHSYLPRLGEYKIVINNEDDVFAITKEDWQPDATKYLRNHKNVEVLVHHLTYNNEDYRDIKVETYRDVFHKLLDLNKQSIFKNPTISLLLHLISIGDSNYSSVFLEWFEEQFINAKILKDFGKKYAKFRKAFGKKYVQEYHALKKKAKTNTGLNEVAKEQPILCVVTKLQTTIEDDVKPAVDELQEVVESDDALLTNKSVRVSDYIDLLSENLASDGFFDDANSTDTSIAWRRGQPEFRRKLLEAYGRRCAITGCSSEEVLEAAHIEPYSKTKNNNPTNGILLRADIHTLFDCDLIGIDPDTMKVCVAPNLVDYHKDFNDKLLQLPEHLHLDIEALRIRYKEYQERLGRYGKQIITNDESDHKRKY